MSDAHDVLIDWWRKRGRWPRHAGAAEAGARVLVLEVRAAALTWGQLVLHLGGLVRFPFHGMDDLRALMPDITDAEAASVEIAPMRRERLL